MMCNLHWCYTFCTGVTLFALVLHLNCTALSQSESSNFFMYIINAERTFGGTFLSPHDSGVLNVVFFKHLINTCMYLEHI